ncbi:MAG: SDR family NAD(P)-dependent oxidoreductase [Firmicutes bacterium]|nr:SDR family NAD(P)-dependent oxidoreductase [Bacillota bacterium]
MQNVAGKVAFITGGASGIGLGIAKAFAKAGMKVVIADLRQDALDEAMTFFQEKKLPVHPVKLDVTDRQAYAQAADEAEKVFGKVHVLVNNAGVAMPGSIEKTTFKDWDFGVNVNLMGVVNGILTFLPRMLAHGEESHIVTTSSMSGLSVVDGNVIYNATKAALITMTETMAADLKNTNVGVSVFCPGPVSSNLGYTSQIVRSEHLKNEEQGQIPPRKTSSAHEAFMSPEEVGLRVLRGIKRKDLYILTHPEFKTGLKARFDAILRAFPDEPINEKRVAVIKNIGTLLYNPIYEMQTTPGEPDWETE